MNKMFISTALATTLIAGTAKAHELWLNSIQNPDGSLTAELAYGHDFPAPEKIAQDRIGLLQTPMVHTSRGKQPLQRDSSVNYLFHTDVPAADAIMLSAEYKPTYWTRNESGWSQGNKQEVSAPLECSQASMHAKHLLPKTTGSLPDVSQPLGSDLELITRQHPDQFRVNQPFTLQVIFNGKPLANAQVLGTFEGFPPEQAAFYGHTNDEGLIDVMPLHPGYWLMTVEHTIPHAKPEICDKRTHVATLTFNIPEAH